MKYNIIFLDVDGVITTFYTISNPFGSIFDKTAITNLKRIVDITKSKIVLSTAWRLSPYDKSILIKELIKNGFTHDLFVGETKNLSSYGKTRDHEILDWVHGNVSLINRWIAIDDMNLKISKNNFVHTSFAIGLNTEKTLEAIKKLTS